MREFLPRIAYDHPVSMFMAFIAFMVLGVIAWWRIPLQLMPDGFEPKFLYVGVPYPNAAPLETDDLLVRPIEAQLATVPGIKSLNSEAGDGSATFFIQFQPSVDMDDTYNAVVDRLERAMPDLPSEVERYWIYKYNPADEPIIWAGIQLPESVIDDYDLMTRVVQPRIERVPGVASIDLWGTNQRVVYVDWDRERLQSLGVSLADVLGRLARDNFQLPAGRVIDESSVHNVRSLARIEDVEELRKWPIRPGVVLSDVADISVRPVASGSIGRINGAEAASLGVSRESSANTVDVARDVRAAFAELEADPRLEGAKFFVFFDQGVLIQDSLNELQKSALEGGLFAVLVLIVFLREWRMTLLITATIPFSLLLTIVFQYFRGDSLNVLSLMGLMLSVGMVVDDAIVVVEAIYQHRAAGKSARDAAIEGTGEVNLAVVSSTLTAMVVFLPIILMSENAEFSFFMGALGFPVVFSRGFSLLVALLFAPLATKLVGKAAIKADPRWLQWISDRYSRTLRWVLAHPFDAGAAMVAMFLLTIIVPMQQVGCSENLEDNLDDFTIRFEIPPQAGLRERDEIVKRFETYVAEHTEDWGVKVYRSRLGGQDHDGRVTVQLLPDGPLEREDVIEAARNGLPDDMPGVKSWIGWDAGTGDSSRTLTLQLHGEEMATLQELAREVSRRAETVDGVIGAEMSYAQGGADEVRLRVDRAAADRYGVDAATIGQTVAFAMRGTNLEPLQEGSRELEVVTRFSLADRQDVQTLLDFPIFSPFLGTSVPLRALTSLEVGKGPSVVHRENRRTAAVVTISLGVDIDPEATFGQLSTALDGMVLPEGYSWERGEGGGWQPEDDKARNLAIVLSIVFVFLIMGMLFESLLLPMAIITTVPMAMMGAWWGLFLTNTPMDFMAAVGLVILVGVVVNNGIVLIDIVGHLRNEGLERTEALVEAGRRRLRPILMTALCTIIGLVPMAFGSSTFVGVPYAPLGRCVMSGMIAGTLLTLVYVPYVYALLDDVRLGAMNAYAAARRRNA